MPIEVIQQADGHSTNSPDDGRVWRFNYIISFGEARLPERSNDETSDSDDDSSESEEMEHALHSDDDRPLSQVDDDFMTMVSMPNRFAREDSDDNMSDLAGGFGSGCRSC